MEASYLFSPTDTFKQRRIIRFDDLRPLNNLKSTFREIRDYFAGNVTGITRDERIAQNMMRLLFCKIYDEKTKPYIVEFANRPNEDDRLLQSRVNGLFDNVKRVYPDLFEANETIEINPDDLSFIVSKLEDYSILDADRDVIGDAFEELIGTSFRGGEGQFFTPREGVFGNPSDRYIWEYVSGICSVTGVVSLYCLYYRIAFRFSDRRALSDCDAASRHASAL